MPNTPQGNNSNSGHRKRLRDRFLYGGGRSLHLYEKLELLLSYSIPRRDVKPIAKDLLNRFGTLHNIMNASVAELCEIKGISENSAGLILLTFDLCSSCLEERMMQKDVIISTSSAVDFARMKIGGCSKEILMIIFLNARNQILDYKCFEHGTVDHTVIYPREVLELCLQKKAASVIFLHNHPSGDCLPSADDMKMTVLVKKALLTVGIKFHDHIIVCSDSFHSMALNHEL